LNVSSCLVTDPCGFGTTGTTGSTTGTSGTTGVLTTGIVSDATDDTTTLSASPNATLLLAIILSGSLVAVVVLAIIGWMATGLQAGVESGAEYENEPVEEEEVTSNTRKVYRRPV
jgi:hypothetical protein